MLLTSSSSARKRNEVDGCFGSGKKRYSLDLIMARLSKGAATMISMAFLVICAEKIRRLIRLFFVIISAWLSAGTNRKALGYILPLDQGEVTVAV